MRCVTTPLLTLALRTSTALLPRSTCTSILATMVLRVSSTSRRGGVQLGIGHPIVPDQREVFLFYK